MVQESGSFSTASSTEALIHWAIRGMAGCVRLLEYWVQSGAKGSADTETDLLHLADRLDRIVRMHRGEQVEDMVPPRKYL